MTRALYAHVNPNLNRLTTDTGARLATCGRGTSGNAQALRSERETAICVERALTRGY